MSSFAPGSETSPPATAEAWHSESVESIAKKLATRLEQGLTAEEAAQRLWDHGPNALAPAAAEEGL